MAFVLALFFNVSHAQLDDAGLSEDLETSTTPEPFDDAGFSDNAEIPDSPELPDDADPSGKRVKVELSGYAEMEFGQIMGGKHQAFLFSDFSGEGKDEIKAPIWRHRTYAAVGVHATINDRLKIDVVPGLRLFYNTIPEPYEKTNVNSNDQLLGKYFGAYIDEAAGRIKIGDLDDPLFEVGIGRFRYKYNQQARNLGEYLFRTGTYPGYFISQFDLAFARLSGFYLRSFLLDGRLSQDILLTMGTEIHPYHNWSLTYLVDADLGGFLNIGAGIMFANLIETEPDRVTPKTDMNSYMNADGDTSYYTFKGVKPMGRLCFDPKRFFDTKIFGEEDLKIYAEAAILGVKDYKAYMYDVDTSVVPDTSYRNFYDNMKERIPIVIGFNFPAFKILDVLSIELEYCGGLYPNSYDEIITAYNPQPFCELKGSATQELYKKDNWKWSIYARKTVLDGFTITAQAARDHIRTESVHPKLADNEETLVRWNNWHWWLKLGFGF